jgi:hypothetical protein
MDPDATDGFPEVIDGLGVKARQLMYRHHHELSDKFRPVDGQLSHYDVFMAGVLRRSYALTRGFFDLIASRNFTAAAPLVRLQLDNALRTAASVWTRDAEEFFKTLREGKQINRMLADEGKPMTDRYLCNRLAHEHPWITQIYNETSAFVHLSDKHFLAAMVPGLTYEGFRAVLADEEPGVPHGAYGDVIVSYIRVTTLVLQQLEIYAKQKYGEHRGA